MPVDVLNLCMKSQAEAGIWEKTVLFNAAGDSEVLTRQMHPRERRRPAGGKPQGAWAAP